MHAVGVLSLHSCMLLDGHCEKSNWKKPRSQNPLDLKLERERERERDICLFNNKVFGDSQRHKFN